VADYRSVIDKAVSALDLNTEKARRRLYERARAALHSEMYSAYPPFLRSEIAAAEMSLEIAIEAVEAEAVREQNAKLAALVSSSSLSVTLGPPGSQKGKVRHSLAMLWTGFLRQPDDGAPDREALPDQSTDSKGRTWLTELLARASRGVDNEGQDFTSSWVPIQIDEARPAGAGTTKPCRGAAAPSLAACAKLRGLRGNNP
jgi:hypothetical protein